MKIGIILSTNDTETCWNALRFANLAREQKDEVKVFMIGKGVEYLKVSNKKFNTIEQAEKLLASGGKFYACGSCIKSRNNEGSEICPISNMVDLYEIVRESDKVITF